MTGRGGTADRVVAVSSARVTGPTAGYGRLACGRSSGQTKRSSGRSKGAARDHSGGPDRSGDPDRTREGASGQRCDAHDITCVRRVHHLAVADVHPHVVQVRVKEHQVARLHLVA